MVGGSSSFWAQRRDSKWLARFVPSHAACRLDDMDNETRQYLVLGAAPNLSSRHRSMSRRIKSSQSPGQSRESRGNRESRLTAETTRLDSLNSTRLDWAGPGWAEPCAAKASKPASSRAPTICPRGTEQPIQQEEAVRLCAVPERHPACDGRKPHCNRPCALPCSHSPLLHAALCPSP